MGKISYNTETSENLNIDIDIDIANNKYITLGFKL